MPNDPRPTKAQRQAEARARAAQIRRQQEAASKRNRILAIGGLTLAALVLVGAVAAVFIQNRANEARYGSVTYGGDVENVVAPALADVTAPSTVDDNGGVPVSDEGVGVAGEGDTVLQVYFDPMCPACGSFETVNGADLRALAAEPGITVVYQPLSFLDHYSNGTHYSTRAGNALMVVADQDPEHFEAFLGALYEKDTQPEENTPGLDDARLGEIAAGVGVPADVVDQFETTVEGTYSVLVGGGTTAASDGTTTEDAPATTESTGTWRTFAPFLAAATSHAQDVLGRISTPTVLLDGDMISGPDVQKVQWNQPGALATYVRAAAQS